jgi:hypothetical protein
VTPLEGGWPARLRVVEPLGAKVLMTLDVGEEQARVLAEPRDWPGSLWLRWPARCQHWFDGRSGERLQTAGEPGSGGA